MTGDSIIINKKKEEELFEKHRKLVYYIAKKNRIFLDSNDYEDIIQVGNIGLIKAIRSYAISKNIKFATYASVCIRNEMLMYLRKERKKQKVIYLEQIIGEDSDGKQLTIYDTIEASDSDSDFIQEIEIQEMFIKIVNIIINCLKPQQRSIMLYRILGFTQKEIGSSLNISSNYVNRLQWYATNIIKKVVEIQIDYKKVFCISKVNDLYNIAIPLEKSNNELLKLLQRLNIKSDVTPRNLIIHLKATTRSFLVIAKIFEEIDKTN